MRSVSIGDTQMRTSFPSIIIVLKLLFWKLEYTYFLMHRLETSRFTERFHETRNFVQLSHVYTPNS